MRLSPRSTHASTAAVVVAVVAALLATLLPVAAGAHSSDRAALDAARRQIEAVERDLAAARQTARSAAQRLAEADRQLRRLENAVNEAAMALERQEIAVEEAAQRVAALEAEMAAQLDAFSLRAADMFKRGVGVPFAVILDAGSIQDAIGRSAYVQALSSSDRASLENIAATRTAVDAERERLDAERQRLAEMKQEQERLLAKVAELREDRALQLASARADVGVLEERKDDLTAESRRIAALIRQRQQEAAAAAAAAKRAASAATTSGASSFAGSVSTSGYQWPRCDTVTSEYGYRWGRLHAGLDIDGNTGDPIYAAKGGVVIFAGWSGGYGRLTLVDHGDGVVTAYAHQSAQYVGDGARVAKGERIGSLGNTGNSTGSHLHFETRVNGDAVNPRRFLPGSC